MVAQNDLQGNTSSNQFNKDNKGLSLDPDKDYWTIIK